MILDKIEYTKEKLQEEIKHMEEVWSVTIFTIDDAANFVLRYKMIKIIIKTIDDLRDDTGEQKTLNTLLDKLNDDMNGFIDIILEDLTW